MKILNLFYSSTGNTIKIADTITKTLAGLGHQVKTVKVTGTTEIDILDFDMVFAGSGVYAWLPGKPMKKLLERLRDDYASRGFIKPGAPRIGKRAVIYCTYGGTHTGINEAVPAVKFMGQLFDHLGFEILDEWHLVGEYHPVKMKHMTRTGRLGDISGRPDEHDLKEVEQRVKGIMLV